ncbi:MAG: tol-pal system protein YbgF [bacterium]|nr:tol-pal system protein YbgF [bacterium]
MRNSICSVGLLVTMMVSGGCSLGSAGKSFGSKGESDSEEVAALKARIVELHRRAVLAEVELARLQRHLTELEGQAPSEVAASDATAPVGRDDAASRPATPVSPVLDDGDASDLEVSDLPLGTTTAAEAPADAPAGGQLDGANPGIDLTVAAQALYDRGYTLFHRGRFVDSETAFQQFLRRYSATVLGDNAQFWIAEARYARGDLNGALAAYRETATRFPDGNKVPDARLKIGDCLRDLGDTEAARTSYRAVVQDFPSSAAAAIAQERLAQSP